MKNKKTPEQLEEMVMKGEDITSHLPKKLDKDFHKKLIDKKFPKNVTRTTVDFGSEIVLELEEIAAKNNISKAAVIKMAVQDYLMKFRKIYK
jgi:hypothetical protein